MGIGLGLALTLIGLVAAVAVGGAGLLGAITEGHTGDLQALAGTALAVSILAGSLAIVAMHVYAD